MFMWMKRQKKNFVRCFVSTSIFYELRIVKNHRLNNASATLHPPDLGGLFILEKA